MTEPLTPPLVDDMFLSCVSKRYTEAYVSGSLCNLVHNDPYRFAFLEDFWDANFYSNIISNASPALRNRYSPGGESNTDVFFEPFDYIEFTKLVYGKVFRRFLATLVGCVNFTRPADGYPQLRTMKGGGGLSIHSDVDAPYNGVAFFNINDNWDRGFGGELVIWEKLDQGGFRKRYEFAPRGNSISVMMFSDNSYHSVNRTSGNWLRSNILIEGNFHYT